MLKNISQSEVKHIITSPIKTITSVLKVSTDIITSITARPIGLSEILMIMPVSTFRTVDYPTLHLDTNESKGTELLSLFYISQSQ